MTSIQQIREISSWSGVIVVVALLVSWMSGEARDWTVYLLCGLGLPLFVFWYRSFSLSRLGRLAIWFLIAEGIYALSRPSAYVKFQPLGLKIGAVTASAACAYLTVYLFRRERGDQGRRLVFFLFAWFCWISAQKLHWWPPGFWPHLWSPYAATGFVAIFLGTTIFLSGPPKILQLDFHRNIGRIIDVLWITFFWLWLFRTSFIVSADSILQHWSFILGPIEQLRRGGWLLWDVPSQYGFFSVALPAWLPIQSAPVALFVVTCGLTGLMTSATYLALRSASDSPWSRIWTGSIVFALTCLLGGEVRFLAGPLAYPSTGPFRFCWSFGMALALVKGAGFSTRGERWMTALFVGFYVVGSLWSAESCLYCQAILFFTSVHAIFLPNSGATTKRLIATLRFLALPVTLLAFTILGISSYYRLVLGNWPDWYAFIEYSLSYVEGFGAMPVNPRGGVCLVGVTYVTAISYAVFLLGTSKPKRSRAAFGLCGMMFVTGSYFVSRSHENNICNLLPFLVIPILLFYRWSLEDRAISWATIFRLYLLPVCTIILTIPLLDPTPVRERLTAFFMASRIALEDQILTGFDFRPTRVLKRNIHSGQPVADLHTGLLPPVPTFGEAAFIPWLPTYPAEEFAILKEPRQRLYLERYLQRTGAGGGSLLHRINEQVGISEPPLVHYQNVRQVLDRYFTHTGTVAVGDGILMETFQRKER